MPARFRILLIMLAAVVALALGETILSKGMKQVATAGSAFTSQILATIGNGWVWVGVALLGLHVGLYMAALREADLSFVLPLTAASYPIAAFLAKFLLHEEIGAVRWAGTLLITLGVAVIGLGDATVRQ